jgi:hypothetical protein
MVFLLVCADTNESTYQQTASNRNDRKATPKKKAFPLKKDDLPADIFNLVLEVLEVLGIANYSILTRVSRGL